MLSKAASLGKSVSSVSVSVSRFVATTSVSVGVGGEGEVEVVTGSVDWSEPIVMCSPWVSLSLFITFLKLSSPNETSGSSRGF